MSNTSWRRRIWFGLGLLLSAVLSGGYDSRAWGAEPRTTHPATGVVAWSEVSGKNILCIEKDRILVSESGRVYGMGIEHRGSQGWTLRKEGLLETWKISNRGRILRTESLAGVVEYKRLPSVPQECDLTPLPVGQTVEISKERAAAIEHELHERVVRDQAVLKGKDIEGKDKEPFVRVTTENTEYIKRLIREVGWIDVPRFGGKASGNAIILAQHSGELPLMLAVLPFIEKDFKGAGENSVMFAIVYDAIQGLLGRKQRYGTRLGKDAKGEPLILPLEDPEHLEQIRKEIGLPPMADYLQLASELYPGKTIRMPRSDE